MLNTKIIVNLQLKRGKIVNPIRSGILRSHRFRSDQHVSFDNQDVQVVQFDDLKFVDTRSRTGRRIIRDLPD